MSDPARALSEPILWGIVGAGGITVILSLIGRQKAWVLWWTLIGLGVLGAGIKALDMLHWEASSYIRQITLLTIFASTLVVAMSRRGLRLRAYVGLSGLWPMNQERPSASQPDRVVLWTLAPPILILAVTLAAGLIAGASFGQVDEALASQLLELLLLTTLGEEVLFRGFLLGLGLLATRPGRIGPGKDRTRQGFWLVSAAFGLWHVPDALLDGHMNEYSVGATLVWVAVTILITTLASRYVLITLRLRTGTVLAPTLTHFAVNTPGIMFGFSPPT